MNHVLKPLLAAALLTGALTAQAKLTIVVTTPDLASLAEAVGGTQIDLTTLARPTEDPHFVDAKPSFIVKLNRADVGWYQIRKALQARNVSGDALPVSFKPFEETYKALTEKLRPQVYSLGFLKN